MAEINITSLVDVMMVLLIIFMLTAPFIQAGVEVRLPKTSSTVIKETEGVIVMDVASGSKGEQAGIEPGDIITEINHNTIKTMEEYTDTIKKIKHGETISMFVKRSNRGFLVIKLTK